MTATATRPQARRSTAATAPPMDVALVHDYLLVLRGAERTFLALAELWPEAPVHTLLYDEEGTQGVLKGRRIRTSVLQRLGVHQGNFRRLLPLYPLAIRRLPLEEHAVVVSSSSAFAHGVQAHPDAAHVCYCHSPFRYAWHEQERAAAELPRPARPLLRVALQRHRAFDRRVVRNITHLVANSQLTRDRIRRFWHRDAEVVHPPVDVDRFRIGRPDDYFLFVGELVAHKRPDLALEAALAAGQRLRVVGSGPELECLRARYGRHAEFLGRVEDDQLAELYAGARAVVVPNVEEFGITAVEAQAAGRPVIAADGGGARETVLDGETGWLVEPGDVRALAEAMSRRDELLSPEAIRDHARRFSTERFQREMREIVQRYAHGRRG